MKILKPLFIWLAGLAMALALLQPSNAQTEVKTMKNVIIMGANGRTAQEIIPRVLEQNDVHLTLFLRHASRLEHMKSERVDVVEGDATNLADVERAMKGQDIVINTMGGMDLDKKTANIIKAMQDNGVKRLISISAGGIYDELPEPFNTWDKKIVGQTRPINRRSAEEIEQSGLTYTILRPVWLTNKPIETVELTQKGETFKGTETSRSSLGRFIADIVKNPDSHKNENLGISQPNTDGDRPAAYR